MSDIESYFNSAEECAAYETFCAEQERGLEKFELAEPALVCRWRMNKRQVPLLNRHIRALSQRVVNGAPLTHNMLSWAKQHVEWSLSEGVYDDPNGVLMLVIDVNGDALMSVGPYGPLVDHSRAVLAARAASARTEAEVNGVAPEVLGAVMPDGRVLLALPEGEPLCGMATLVEQLVQTKGRAVEHALAAGESVDDFVSAAEDATLFLVSDEHGVVLAQGMALDPDASSFVSELADGVRKLYS